MMAETSTLWFVLWSFTVCMAGGVIAGCLFLFVRGRPVRYPSYMLAGIMLSIAMNVRSVEQANWFDLAAIWIILALFARGVTLFPAGWPFPDERRLFESEGKQD